MKKKGFTLIELLAVIVILTIIALITIPLILNTIEMAKKGAFKDTAYGLIESAELYYSKNQLTGNSFSSKTIEFPNSKDLNYKGTNPEKGTLIINKKGKIALAISNDKYCIKKGFQDTDITFLENVDNCEIDITNKVTKVTLLNNAVFLSAGETSTISVTIEPLDADNPSLKWISSDESIATVEDGIIRGIKQGTATITVETMDGSKIKKEIEVTIDNYYKNGIMKSESECILNGTCKLGTEVIVQVNETESHLFYVLEENEDDFYLLMDRNVGDRVAWCSVQDYKNAGGPTKGYYGFTTELGPITALNYLKEQTKDWSYIESSNITLPTGNQIAKAGKVSWNASLADGTAINYTEEEWLNSYLKLGGSGEYAEAYWTSTAHGKSSGGYESVAWRVAYGGSLSYVIMDYTSMNFGVRPVLHLSK